MPDMVKYRCPHLGLENDPATWFAFPTAENHCHMRRSPRAVEPSYQQEFCLSDHYVECSLMTSQKQTRKLIPASDGMASTEPIGAAPGGTDPVSMDLPGTDEEEPAKPRRRLAPWMWGALILAVIGGAGLVIGGPLWSQHAPAPQPPTSTPELQPTEIPTATLEPTIAPTATLPPAATTPPTPAVTAAPSTGPSPAATELILALAFDSYVRAGPGRYFATVAYLNAGTLVTVLGRDLDGFWLLVRLHDGREGWVAITQFPADQVNIKSIPVAPEIPTPDVTATPEA